MAFQHFGVKVRGTLDEITFLRRQGEDIVKLKGGVSKERILSDPNFQRTRENMSEFGLAGKEGKELVDALAPLIGQAYDPRYFSRLVKILRTNIDTDTANARGERQIQYANFGELLNFSFNNRAKLSNVLRAPYEVFVTTNDVVVEFAQGIKPKWDLKSAPGATRFQLGLIVAKKVTGENFYRRWIELGTINPLNADMPDGTTISALTTPVAGETYEAVVVAFGIFFGQEVNGGDYAFHNKSFNALDIIVAQVP